jgi:hypothetical protein
MGKEDGEWSNVKHYIKNNWNSEKTDYKIKDWLTSIQIWNSKYEII